MVQHIGRLGVVAGLALLLACGSANAKDGGTDGGTAPQSQGASGKKASAPAKKTDDAATPKPEGDTGASAKKGGGGGKCTGKATLCGVYSEMFCSSQPGCNFQYGSRTCGGLPIACEKADNAAFCEKIKGCSWQ